MDGGRSKLITKIKKKVLRTFFKEFENKSFSYDHSKVGFTNRCILMIFPETL